MVQAVIQTTVTGLQGNPIATGTPGGNQSLTWNGTAWAPAGPFMSTTGGTLTGPLVLVGNATAQLNPVPLQQLQAGYLPLVGGTITGNLTVNGTGSFGSLLVLASVTCNGNAAFLGAVAAGTNSPGNVAAGCVMTSNGIRYNPLGAQNTTAFVWNGGSGFNAYADVTSIGVLITQASDATLKENFSAVTVDCLSVLNQITLQQFDWKPLTVGTETIQKPHSNCGFTAQQLETLIPEAVVGTASPLGVDTVPMVAYCIGALQRIVLMIQQLQGAVGTLQTNANATVTAWNAV